MALVGWWTKSSFMNGFAKMPGKVVREKAMPEKIKKTTTKKPGKRKKVSKK